MRRSLMTLVVLASLTGSALADSGTAETTVTNYSSYTLAADGLALGAFLGGMAAEGPGGRDTTASSALMAAGMFGSFLASPIIHLARHHEARALGSFAMRSVLAGVAMVIAVETASCSPNEFLCGVDRLGPGMVTGLVVASLLDSALLTNEETVVARPTTGWAPQIAPTSGGVRFGLMASF